eukprot:15366748-Ditylum_brightwellii.AAC.2
MFCSMRYIHSKGIIHHSLRVENFFFSADSPNSELKMIAFRLSKHFKFGEVQYEAVGMPFNVVPELFSGSYNENCVLLIPSIPSVTTSQSPKPIICLLSHSLPSMHMSAMPEHLCPFLADDESEGSLMMYNEEMDKMISAAAVLQMLFAALNACAE